MTVLAWHFLQPDGTVPRLNVKAVPGLLLEHVGPLRLCESGLHASVKALDALKYAQSFIVSRVECGGETAHRDDKLVCSRRRVIWVADAKVPIIEFACWCAERALQRRKDAGKVTDGHSWRAIEIIRAWLVGRATIEELQTARRAAYAAAYANAAYAVTAAANAAAYADAAAYAATAANAAYAAADAASERDASERDAAERDAAERDAQAAKLEELLLSLEEIQRRQ